MARIKLTVAYDGTDFSGWQLQPRQRTVQGVVEKAIMKITHAPARVHGSGRTDSGVHAMGQVAHFNCDDHWCSIPWQRALNGHMPKDVRILHSEVVDDDFHARYSARGKVYEYTLWHHSAFCLPQRRRFVWNCGTVDFETMESAAAILLGTHDFAAFQNVGTVVKTTTRTITSISRRPGITEHETIWRFEANGFLKQMVRIIMSCLVACGRGKLSVEELQSILESADRSKAPATAPPQGLSLISVHYP